MKNLTTNRLTSVEDKHFIRLQYSEENATIACSCSHNSKNDRGLFGKQYKHFENCDVCQGYGKVAIETSSGLKKWLSCKNCKGTGILPLDEPVILGPCKVCNGTMKLYTVSPKDFMTSDDLKLLITIVDFRRPIIAKTLHFDECFVGVNTIIGNDDQGAWKRLKALKRNEMITDVLLQAMVPYKVILRDGQVCSIIKVKLTDNGWRLIPSWDEVKKKPKMKRDNV